MNVAQSLVTASLSLNGLLEISEIVTVSAMVAHLNQQQLQLRMQQLPVEILLLLVYSVSQLVQLVMVLPQLLLLLLVQAMDMV